MKKAYHNTSWFLKDDNTFCGVNFGYDFCTEHEIGISGIRESFGIKTFTENSDINSIKKIFNNLKTNLGINTRKITKKPETLQFEQKGIFHCIYYSSFKLTPEVFDTGIKSLAWEMIRPGGKDLICYWGDNSFMIVTTNESHFQELKKEFNKINIAIYTAGINGLVICIPDKVDTKIKSDMYTSDFDSLELRIKTNEIGIEKKLKKANKQFYALIPAWKNKSTKDIHFFLNPFEQQKYNYGWFTIDELNLWIDEKGPIIKIEKKVLNKKNLIKEEILKPNKRLKKLMKKWIKRKTTK